MGIQRVEGSGSDTRKIPEVDLRFREGNTRVYSEERVKKK